MHCIKESRLRSSSAEIVVEFPYARNLAEVLAEFLLFKTTIRIGIRRSR
jgi:hypothetical protein